MFVILMNFIFVFTGIFLVAIGLIGWKKKKIKMFCGIRKMQVDVDKFVKYMGIVTVVWGIYFIVLGVLDFFYTISALLFLPPLILFFVAEFLVEKKCKLES